MLGRRHAYTDLLPMQGHGHAHIYNQPLLRVAVTAALVCKKAHLTSANTKSLACAHRASTNVKK